MNNSNILKILLCVFAMELAFSFGSLPLLSQSKQQKKESVESANKKYEFNRRDYSKNPQKGFAVVMDLIIKAKKENAPPETLARLYYSAAGLQTRISRYENSDSRPAISILNTVLKNPDRYLVNREAAKWYANCVSQLTSIYQRHGNSDEEIFEALKISAKAAESAKKLSQRERFLISTSIRLIGSDVALRKENWKTAIKWLNPIIESADVFLKDDEGASYLAMASRQQSLFLYKNGELDKSSQLVDSICKKLENADSVSQNQRLAMQCLLRGKHLFTFAREPKKPQAIRGWKKYRELRSRVKKLPDKQKQYELYWHSINMDRLAVVFIDSQDIDAAIKILNETIEQIKSVPELQKPESRILGHLNDIARMVCSELRQQRDPRALEIKQLVDEFVSKCEEANQKNKNGDNPNRK